MYSKFLDRIQFTSNFIGEVLLLLLLTVAGRAAECIEISHAKTLYSKLLYNTPNFGLTQLELNFC